MEDLLKIKRAIEIRKIINSKLQADINIIDVHYKFKKEEIQIKRNVVEDCTTFEISSDFKMVCKDTGKISGHGLNIYDADIITPMFIINIYKIYMYYIPTDTEHSLMQLYFKITGIKDEE